MNKELLFTFIIFNILNVVIQTIKSIVTLKGTKTSAALVNAIAYGLYSYIIILTNADLPLLTKCLIVGLCNLIGVYIVKWAEERARKAKLWKVELTVRNEEAQKLHEDFERFNIPHNYIPNVGKWTIFNVYCATQKESHFTKEIANKAHAKYFVTETKEL